MIIGQVVEYYMDQQGRIKKLLYKKIICEKYLVGGQLNKGGYGQVYLGLDLTKNQMVAIKVIDELKVTSKSGLQRIKNQPFLLQRFSNNPFVVKMLDTYRDQDNRLTMIVMELCDMGTLGDYLYIRGVIPKQQAKIIIKQVFISLLSLHCHGVWHRDIKPDNFLGKYDKFMVSDFGEGKILTEQDDIMSWKKTKNKKATLVGTRHFQAPQILQGEKYSNKVDLYSAVVMYYQMRTGTPAFKPQIQHADQLKDKNRNAKKILQTLHTIYSEEYIQKMATDQGITKYNCILDDDEVEFMKKFIRKKQERKNWIDILSDPFLEQNYSNDIILLPLKIPLNWSNFQHQIALILSEEIQPISFEGCHCNKAIYSENKDKVRLKKFQQKSKNSFLQYQIFLNNCKQIYFLKKRNNLLFNAIHEITREIGQQNNLAQAITQYIILKQNQIQEKQKLLFKVIQNQPQQIEQVKQQRSKRNFLKNVMKTFGEKIINNINNTPQLINNLFFKQQSSKIINKIVSIINREKQQWQVKLNNNNISVNYGNLGALIYSCRQILELEYHEKNVQNFNQWRSLREIAMYKGQN